MHTTQKTALVLFVASSGFVLFICGSPKKEKLIYQGRSIDYWFAQLPPTLVLAGGLSISGDFIAQGPQFGSRGLVAKGGSYTVLGRQYGSKEDASIAFAAFNSFGSEATPFLMGKLLSEDSAIEQEARNLALKAKMDSFPPRMAAIEKLQAVTGLIYIHNLPTGIVQTLTDLSKDATSKNAHAAKYILDHINDDKAVLSQEH